MTCGIREARECACPADSCRVQTRSIAPTISFSWRQHAITVGFGFAVAALTFIAIAPTEQKLKAEALDCQEACVVTWQK